MALGGSGPEIWWAVAEASRWWFVGAVAQGGGLEPSGSQSERAGLGQQAAARAALHQRRRGVKS